MNQENITPYQDVNTILFYLSNEIRHIMPENLTGIYLTGSLSYGDFNYDSSDIDLIVVVKRFCTHSEIDQIKALYKKVETQYPKWAQRLECSYISVEMFKNILPPKEPRPYHNSGIFYEEAPYGNEWIINNYLVYKHGVPLIGPDIKDLVPPASMIEVQKACIRDLFQEWVPKIKDVEWLDNSHYQSYFVLTLCRILYTVVCSKIGTKKASAAWAKKEFGNPWQKLIETAEDWVYGKEMKSRDEAVDFLKFVMNKVRETEPYKQLYIAVLSGGRVTQGVVKIDDTVRRPLGKNSEYTHKVLKYLEYVGFKGAPRFLGVDDEGREILSYIAGDVPTELGFFTDTQLVAAAQLIRQFHDAVSNIPLVGNEEVVNHNDLSPCNTVLMNGLPMALIDFDAAAPGSRVHDLAYAVWLWCDLGNEDIQVQEQARRIKLFCDSYGFDCRANFISAIMERQQEAIESYQHQVEAGFIEWQDAIKWGKHCLQWVTQNAELLGAL